MSDAIHPPERFSEGGEQDGTSRRQMARSLHEAQPETIMRRSLAHGLTALSLAALIGCADAAATIEEVGECSDAFGADVCTWAMVEANTVVAVGATVPMASIENAPADAPFTWPPTMTAAPNLPASATEQSGFTHMTMLWEAMGHTPVTYLTPHFDFHFYLVPPSERMAIDCDDLTKPSTLPEGYSMPDEQLPPELVAVTGVEILIGVCVPEMGMHALVTVEMQSEELFGGTMVVGYYKGEPIFIEPMISKAMLQERQSFELSIPEIPGLEGRQPSTFRADYDADQDAYRFTFSDFAAGS